MSCRSFQDLRRRGVLNQSTDPNALEALVGSGCSAYCGFDPTADSLHVGHLVSLTTMRRLAELGIRPILLIGGATGAVGDPSFRSSARSALDMGQVASNARAVADQISSFMRGTDHLVVDNADWLTGRDHLQFMAEVGSKFSVSRMLAFDSVKTRLEDGLTFFELGYMLLQAFDFVELSRRHGCVLQVGGSDQWANIVNGIDLGRRMDGIELQAMTVPLLVDAAGRKMGKSSADGTVWLSAARTSPRDMWQFWRNVDDAVVLDHLRLLTDLPLEAIAELEGRPNDAKIALADAMLLAVHGLEGRPEAQVVQLGPDRRLLAAMVEAGLARSISDARRLVQQGGVRVDGEVAAGVDLELPEEGCVLAVGRKKEVVVSFERPEARPAP